MKKLDKKISIIWKPASIILLLLVAWFVVIPWLGSFLVYDTPLQSSDAIVILMGSIPDRVLQSYEIYQQGYAPLILMVPTYQTGMEHLDKYDIEIPTNAHISQSALLDLGIPEEAIILLPGSAQSTKDEARAIYQYLQTNNEIESIILVSSAHHLRRAAMIFRRQLKNLNREITVIPRPSSYTDFHARHWYKDRQSAKYVATEWLKLISWIVFERWFF